MTIIYQDNFDSTTTNTAPSGWAVGQGGFVAQTYAALSKTPISGTKGFAASNDGDSMFRTDTPRGNQGARFATIVDRSGGRLITHTLRSNGNQSSRTQYVFYPEYNSTGIRFTLYRWNNDSLTQLAQSTYFACNDGDVLHQKAFAMDGASGSCDISLWLSTGSAAPTQFMTYNDPSSTALTSGVTAIVRYGPFNACILDNYVCTDGAGGEDVFYTAPAAPVLSSTTGSATSATSLTCGVNTDTASGTLYLLLDTSTTATNTAIAASSRSQVVSSNGAKTFTATGLTPGSMLYPHFVQVVSGVYSNVITGSAITLPSAGAPDPATINSITAGNSQVTVSFTPGAANGATITGHVLKVYQASDNTLVSTSSSSTTSPISGTAVNGVAVYGKIESTNSAGTSVSSASGTVTPSATVTTSTITPPDLPLATAAGATGSGSVWASEPVKIVVINATDPTQATQVFSQTTSSVGKLSPLTITGSAGFLAQVMVWRVADRTFLGSFPATST